MTDVERPRSQWGSRMGFVLAAAGSAVGLGSIWKFPYITGANGGGWFVLMYLVFVAAVATPVMIAEIMVGRLAARSPVGAFEKLATPRSSWRYVGWLGLACAFVILSYYLVVAGWTLHYAWLALTGELASVRTLDAAHDTFVAMYRNPAVNVGWFAAFLAATAAIVAAGVQRGVERANRILVPLLLLLMLGLVLQSLFRGGMAETVDFVFAFHGEDLSSRGMLEALGHSFYTLSIGMGAMITYGSYMRADENVAVSAVAVASFDTVVSLLACLAVFPVAFAAGLAPAAGPGLVFETLPVAFAQAPGGAALCVAFFVVLAVAALASTVSVCEVLVSHACERYGLRRGKALLLATLGVFAFGVPSAIAGGDNPFGTGLRQATAGIPGGGVNWFDAVDRIASNGLLPVSALGIAIFVAWRIDHLARSEAFGSGGPLARLQRGWLALLRYVVPPAIVLVFLNALGLFG